jgi:hypothetical protein
MALLRANTMQRITSMNMRQSIIPPFAFTPRKKPIIAKGMANKV